MTATPAQARLGKTQLDLAKRFGVGGDTWSITRPSGNGVTGPGTTTDAGSVTAYVRRQSLGRLEQALAQTRVGTAVWRVYAPEGQDIRVNDVLTSAAESTLVFAIKELSADRGILVGLVEPNR